MLFHYFSIRSTHLTKHLGHPSLVLGLFRLQLFLGLRNVGFDTRILRLELTGRCEIRNSELVVLNHVVG